MKPEKAIELLNKSLSEIPALKNERRTKGECKNAELWNRNTKVALGKIFGDKSTHQNEFESVHYYPSVFMDSTPDSFFDEEFCSGLDTAAALLTSMKAEIEEFGLNGNFTETSDDPVKLIAVICNRFHYVARQLRQRYNGRQTIEIEDEYDTQDLFHALLKLYFDDIRPEEYTPSYAGSSTRVDFLLKKEKIIIEIKKTRASLKPKDVGEQLILDIAHYQAHPDCETLVCFVYDPEGRIANPTGIETDLERNKTGIDVKVIISPK